MARFRNLRPAVFCTIANFSSLTTRLMEVSDRRRAFVIGSSNGDYQESKSIPTGFRHALDAPCPKATPHEGPSNKAGRRDLVESVCVFQRAVTMYNCDTAGQADGFWPLASPAVRCCE